MKRSKYFFLTALLLLFAMAVSAQEADISIKQSTLDFLNNSGFAMIGQNWKVILMIAISCLLFFLAIVKQYEPLLLLPIAFGMLLTNLPGANMYHPELWSAFLDANSPAYHSYGAIMANGGLLDILYIGVNAFNFSLQYNDLINGQIDISSIIYFSKLFLLCHKCHCKCHCIFINLKQ